jgi:hypothetical protein
MVKTAFAPERRAPCFLTREENHIVGGSGLIAVLQVPWGMSVCSLIQGLFSPAITQPSGGSATLRCTEGWLHCKGGEFRRGTLTRLTAPPLIPYPIWTPDGKHVTLVSGPTGILNLYRMPASGQDGVPGLGDMPTRQALVAIRRGTSRQCSGPGWR